MALGAAGPGQRLGEARRALLQQRHVPGGPGEQAVANSAVRSRLTWTWVSLRSSIRSSRERQLRSSGSGGKSRPWKRFQVIAVNSTGRSIRRLTRSEAERTLTNFLTGEELGAFELGKLLDRAAELKAGRREGVGADALAGRSVALVFEKPSTRTRISFEVGVAELGATPIVLRGDEMQLSRGESIGDTARVLSRYVDAIVIRSGSHETVAELAAAAEVPVVNALTPLHHPCQALADLLTMRERFGDLEGLRLAYVGDGNNVARSLAIARRARRGRGRRRGARRLPAGGGPRGEADRRPARRRRRRRRPLHRRLGQHGRRGRGRAPPRRPRPVPARRRPPRRRQAAARSSSTACRPTPARRSPPRSSTASTRPSGTRPRTGCTRRRRCWRRCLRGSPFGRIAPATQTTAALGAVGRACIPRSTSAR